MKKKLNLASIARQACTSATCLVVAYGTQCPWQQNATFRVKTDRNDFGRLCLLPDTLLGASE
jgi:hypothetical protein